MIMVPHGLAPEMLVVGFLKWFDLGPKKRLLLGRDRGRDLGFSRDLGPVSRPGVVHMIWRVSGALEEGFGGVLGMDDSGGSGDGCRLSS